MAFDERLTFYWQPMVRQVRVRGNVVYLGDEASTADYLDRPDGRAKAMNREGLIKSRVP